MIKRFFLIILTFINFNLFIKSDNQSYFKIPNQNFIILLDNTHEENIQKTLNTAPNYDFMEINHPTGIGAMTITYLIALYQKAAPILVNKSLIQNVIDHANLFKDFLTLPSNSLYSKYSSFSRFNNFEYINELKTNINYVHKQQAILKQKLKNIKDDKQIDSFINNIIKDRNFNEAFAPNGLKHFTGSSANRAKYFEMVIYEIAYNNPLNFDDWIIKNVNDDLYLLIPKSYIQQNINISNPNFEYTTNQTLTDLEKSLGLKVNHLKDINSWENEFSNQQFKYKFSNLLNNIFVTSDESNNNNIWSIYIAGHGFPSCPQINLLPQLKKLEKFYDQQIHQKKFNNCIKSLQETNYYFNHQWSCKYHKEFEYNYAQLQKLKLEIETLKNEIKYITDIQKGVIVSLSKKEFQNTLKFFNDKVKTAFFFYTSCYGGGEHLIKPYFDKGKALIFNYPILCGTLAENMSMQEMPVLNIPPYSFVKVNAKEIKPSLTKEDLDLKNKNLNLVTTLQFNDFFNSLKNGLHNNEENLVKLVFSLHPYTDKINGKIRYMCMGNIPSFRKAGSDKFYIIPHDESFIVIDNEKLNKNKNAIDISKDAALLYSDYIPHQLIVKKNKFNIVAPHVSMIPGLAAHTLEEINAIGCSLPQVLNSFLCFPELAATKTFWIKKLKCTVCPKTQMFKKSRNDKEIELNDIIIMRNIADLDRPNINGQRTPPMKNAIYLSSTKNNKHFQILNQGPLVHENNYKIITCKSNKHRRELLAIHPKVKKHIKTKILA